MNYIFLFKTFDNINRIDEITDIKSNLGEGIHIIEKKKI